MNDLSIVLFGILVLVVPVFGIGFLLGVFAGKVSERRLYEKRNRKRN